MQLLNQLCCAQVPDESMVPHQYCPFRARPTPQTHPQGNLEDLTGQLAEEPGKVKHGKTIKGDNYTMLY